MATSRTKQRTTRSATKTKSRSQTQQLESSGADPKGNITNLLKEKGALTRGEITTKTGIPRTTVYDTLMNLLLSGVVEKYIERNGQRGRPSVYYQLVA